MRTDEAAADGYVRLNLELSVDNQEILICQIRISGVALASTYTTLFYCERRHTYLYHLPI